MKEEITIFDLLYSKYKISKPIRLIELFGGYGSQALALKYLGVDFEHWKLCEWAIKSIQAYKDIHFENDNNDYSASFDIDFIKKFLIDKGISQNYNEPMTNEQIKRMSETSARKVFNNIVATHNLVNISQVKGKDLEITHTDKYDYILTYSFPCQDLSLAGKGKGMKDTSTRSGLLWEVERILGELKEKPQILLMENVPQVHSQDNIEDFKKWILRLEELGYQNYWQDLIATDFGIPQTRNRCFMVSILGEYSYKFPKKQKLVTKLKDLLEEKVDERFYLSDKMKKYIFSDNDKYKVNTNSLQLNREIACTKTTREGNTRADSSDYVTEDYKLINKAVDKLISQKKVIKNDTLYTNYTSRRIKQNDFIQNNNISPTLTTSAGNEIGVVVHSSPTIRTKSDNAGAIKIVDCVGTFQYAKSDNFMHGKKRLQLGKEVSDTIQTTQKEGIVSSDLRIRKLTPKECFRLMGIKDEDYDKCAKNQSDSSLYHLAGDSIVVNVLMAIFGELL